MIEQILLESLLESVNWQGSDTKLQSIQGLKSCDSTCEFWFQQWFYADFWFQQGWFLLWCQQMACKASLMSDLSFERHKACPVRSRSSCLLIWFLLWFQQIAYKISPLGSYPFVVLIATILNVGVTGICVQWSQVISCCQYFLPTPNFQINSIG